MNKNRTALLAITILLTGLLIGGTGGAIAAGQIGTAQLKNNAVTSPKIKNKTVKTVDIAPAARGAQVIQYVANGSIFDSANSTVVQLPGTWNAQKLAGSAWSVQLVRNGPPSLLFSLGQSANAGEGTGDGFYITVSDGILGVRVNAPSYSVIDEIRITRTVATKQNSNTVLARVRPRSVAGG